MRVLWVVGVLVGCESAVLNEEVPLPTWNQDIKPIMETHCLDCHQQGQIGGFGLETYDEVFELRNLVQTVVENRSMPPWGAGPDCNDYAYDLSLTDEQIDRIAQWVETGAPEGDGPPELGLAREQRRLSRTDFTIEMPLAYRPVTFPDDYRCFVIEWPVEEAAFVTGYSIRPGNDAVVHHVIAYLGGPEHADAYDAMDPEGEGYTCFGGPGVVDDADAQWLGGWAPGAAAGDLPEGTGIYVEPGSRVILQVHYNATSEPEDSDLSSVDFMIEEEVVRPGLIQPWANPLWLVDADSMLIEAQQTGVEHSFSFPVPDDLLIHTAALHMHQLGTDARLSIERTDGSETCLLEVPDWDFNWQRTYLFQEPVVLQSGDSINVTCHWDNLTDEPVSWGDGTGDEMCLGTMFMTLP